MFVTLYEQGLVYRGDYLVNWDPENQTVISNEEVDNVERPGHLWTVRYPVVDEAGEETGEHVDIATTRPETIPADTAVAVHPEDERFRDLVGKSRAGAGRRPDRARDRRRLYQDGLRRRRAQGDAGPRRERLRHRAGGTGSRPSR